MISLRVAGGLGIGVFVLCMTGCGDGRPQTYPVEGRIRFENGQPVPYGNVEFRSPAMQLSARGKLDSQGRFTLSTFTDGDGAVAGEHQIVVVQSFSPLSLPAGGQHTREHGHKSQLVASRYSDYRSSGLETTIEAKSSNHVDLRVSAQ